MNWERLVTNVGEVARPLSIHLCSGTLCTIAVLTRSEVMYAALVTYAAGLIGMRGVENIYKTRAESIDKQTKAGIPPIATVGPNDNVVIEAATQKKGKK